MNDLIAVPLLAFLLSLFLVPIVRYVAKRLNIVDKPDAHRKMHGRAIALGGGLAVLASVLLTVGAAMAVPNAAREPLLEQTTSLFWMMVAATLLCMVGIIDDRKPLRGKHKLMGQVAAVLIVILFSGLCIERLSLFGWSLALGPLAIPVTAFWILGCINSLNLCDGVDGFATSIGIILCLALGAMALLLGDVVDATLALAMVGALAGFLYFNFSPASIFLGDTGSMLIGFVAGVLALRAAPGGPTDVPVIFPLAVWSIALFDTSVAILRRKLTGRSIYSTDRGHLHHCLLKMGQSAKQCVGWAVVLCSITAGGAVLSVLWTQEIFAVMTVLAVLGALVCTGVFGHAEFLLVGNHARNLAAAILKPVSRQPITSRHVRIQLQGSRNWDDIWEQLKQSAELLGYNSVKLDVNLPVLHEGYHAAWQRTDSNTEDDCWTTVVPLLVKNRRIGRLEISGTRHLDGTVYGWLGQLAEILDSVELRVGELMRDLPMLPAKNSRVHFADGPERHTPRKVRLTGFWPVDAGS